MSVKLTQFSKASGCGCKIAPSVLEEILKDCKQQNVFDKLLVGNQSNDDAAVYELDNDNCIISTTDFFTPIVDNAHDFGRISAANALSDIYAMGGKPLMALAILGWPIEKISPKIAQEVIKGAQEICSHTQIPLAGGHSVETQEPLFGLAVTGIAKKQHIKKNNTLQKDDVLYLTKPLGVGVLSTALKRGLLTQDEYHQFLITTTQLNNIGYELGKLPYITAMTDVTGFGLVGHLLEMLSGTNLTAIINKNSIPILEDVKKYISQFVFPDNTTRNYNAQSTFVSGMENLDFIAYCDPQTSGGLIFGVNQHKQKDVEFILQQNNCTYYKIGSIAYREEKEIVFV